MGRRCDVVAVDLALRAAVWALTIVAWIAALVLVRAARRAHIGALTERAVAAVIIAGFGTLWAIVRTAQLLGLAEHDAMVTIIRVGVLVLLTIPVGWAVLYVTGRLGDNGDGGP